jgi:phage gp36-like protein
MPYCTQDDIEKMMPLSDLADLTTESGATPDAGVVSEVIAKAGAEIDSYLAVRYVLPLAATPDEIKHRAVDLAIYYLYARRSMMPEIRRDNYKDAVAWLKDVAAGRAVVTGVAGVELPGASDQVVEVSSSTRVFSRDTLGGW